MNIAYVIAALLALTSGRTLNGVSCEREYRVEGDELVDSAIPYISKFLIDNHLDPLDMSDFSESSLTEDPSNILYDATLGLRSGKLYNMSTLRRNNSAFMVYKGRELTLETGVAFDELSAESEYWLETQSLRTSGLAKITARSVNARVAAKVDLANYKLTLADFTVYDVARLDVDLTGHELSDWLLTLVTNVVVNLHKEKVMSMVEKQALIKVQERFDEIADRIRPRR